MLWLIDSNTEIVDSPFTQAQVLSVPWKSIATSVPCWALLISTLGNNWAFYMLIVQLPIYMKTILHFDMTSVSINTCQNVIAKCKK